MKHDLRTRFGGLPGGLAPRQPGSNNLDSAQLTYSNPFLVFVREFS